MRMRACVWFIAGNKNKRTADRMQVSYLPFCTLNRHFGGVPPLRGLVVDGEFLRFLRIICGPKGRCAKRVSLYPISIFFDIFWRVAKNRERKKRPLLAHNQYAFPGVRVCKIGGAMVI
jgi:hypothetical protein